MTGDRLVLAPIYVTEAGSVPLPAPDTPLATWTNGITLAQSELVQDDGPSGLSLSWWSGATLHQDYTLFAQVLDRGNRILAQADLRGERPTSTWRAGDHVPLAVRWEAAPGADLAEWQQVIVGWYDNAGVRLSLQEGGDYVVVATRGE